MAVLARIIGQLSAIMRGIKIRNRIGPLHSLELFIPKITEYRYVQCARFLGSRQCTMPGVTQPQLVRVVCNAVIASTSAGPGSPQSGL